MNVLIWLLDFAQVAFSVAIGFFLGLAGLLMAQLIGMGAWVSVGLLLVFGLVLYFGLNAMDRVSDWILPSGIKKAPPGTPKTNPYNKRRKRNGWIGFAVGIIIALVASLFVAPQELMGMLPWS